MGSSTRGFQADESDLQAVICIVTFGSPFSSIGPGNCICGHFAIRIYRSSKLAHVAVFERVDCSGAGSVVALDAGSFAPSPQRLRSYELRATTKELHGREYCLHP